MRVAPIFALTAILTVPAIAAPAANLQVKPVDYALQLLQHSCAEYVAAAQQSAAARDLALYCLGEGETIAIQAANSPVQIQRVKSTIAQWRRDIQSTLALK